MGKRASSKYWIVLKTKQASSSDAVANVRNQTFEYLHPQFRKRALNGVRSITALFPHYLMVRVDDRRQDWRVLNSTKGVASILMNCDKPSRVPDDHVDRIRVLTDDTDDGYYHDPEHDAPRYTQGDAVEGLRGLFLGKFGIYRGLAGNRRDRIRVLFDILGRSAEFELGADDVRVSVPAY